MGGEKEAGASAGAQTDSDTARVASRGVIFIASAKLYFLGIGYAIQFGLAHILTEELYGAYGTVVSVVNVLNMMVLQGTLQSVSKLVSENEQNARAVRGATVRVQFAVGGAIAALYVLFAPWIADIQNSTPHTDVFRLSAAIVLVYSFYAIFVGTLNGRKQFRAQAALDMTYATLRAAGILGLAALGLGVAGAIGGFVSAACVILPLSIVVVHRLSPASSAGASPVRPRAVVAFMLPVMLYTLILYALMNVDLWFLRAFSDATAQETDRIAGIYYGAQNIARIPYQAILAVTFVVFPLVSRAVFDKEIATAQTYITVTLRYSLIFLAGLVAVIAGNAADILAIPYPSAYREAARSLEPLSIGMLVFSLLGIANTILIGAGQLRAAIVSAGVALASTVAATFILRATLGALDGRAVAIAAGVGFLAGCVVAGFSLQKRFGAPLAARTLARVGLAMGVVLGLSLVRPPGGRIVTLAFSILLLVVYGAVLWAIGEWRPDDTARFRRAFARRRRS